jgi:hypothetical protein
LVSAAAVSFGASVAAGAAVVAGAEDPPQAERLAIMQPAISIAIHFFIILVSSVCFMIL